MGIDSKTFTATMNRYNEYCEKVRDLKMYRKPGYPRPIKKAPLHAFRQQNFTNTTHNGIAINENVETLAPDSQPGIRQRGDRPKPCFSPAKTDPY